METDTHTTNEALLLNTPRAQEALGKTKNSIKIYGVLSAVALATVIGVSGSGHTVNTFMWVRAVLLPVVAVLIYRMTLAASRGSRRAFERVRTLALIMPIAIVGVDLIPGVCPLWYAVMQIVCMLPVVRAAFITRGSALRAAFPKPPLTPRA
ncbi:hypothetical protein GO001_25350 [Streptomyces sp. NRRL B-1677]|uniref:Uncharacterized protein n=1 Tax=Streptomyces klenkii TaxID=1420899 RepID=A0A3B0C105_9ACTN|nr:MULTISPECIES: hypothetical protein [Streptomyces]MBF6048493.1 hypothetical protein [Streptomyces sp. NRRL B-1677]RKN77617.1 hypothetical protein D7231_02640 [Streptomyces klenkii]